MDYHLERFVKAQENVYLTALDEIRSGRKQSHWMWFIFPQLKGLGFSFMANIYGLDGLAEADEYLKHPVLGPRLREITAALLPHGDIPAETVMGPIDALKLKSCMTLFDVLSPDDIFRETLNLFYGGQTDERTMRLLAKQGP